MTTTENPDAGQGPVLLDIGGDVGALIVTMPAETEALEVEIRPRGATAAKLAGLIAAPHQIRESHSHTHPHDVDQAHEHTHPHAAGPAHGHVTASFPHVAVVGRSAPAGVHYSLVYPSLTAGEYELCPMPGDDVVLTATVVGGQVTHVAPSDRMPWPEKPPLPSSE